MEKRKPSLLWALAALIIPIGVILYGTVWVGVRPPVLPLLAALALAAIMCLPIGYSWAELQEGMFEALGRIQIAIAIRRNTSPRLQMYRLRATHSSRSKTT